jgi:hypothetical protein
MTSTEPSTQPSTQPSIEPSIELRPERRHELRPERRHEATMQPLFASPILLWLAFVLVHFLLGALNIFAPGVPMGDVSFVYKFWTDQAVVSHYFVGIDSSWVYPIVAFVPMMLARVFGPANYDGTWLSLVMILDAVAFAFIIGFSQRTKRASIAWWWLGFLVLLGPIAMGRIDSITIPLAIVAVLLISSRPRVASLLLTVATWIKVWPAAILLALFLACKTRATMITTAAITTFGIIAAALALGSGSNIFSFVNQQTDRGLQVEAPVSTIWLWMAAAHVPNALAYYDQTMLTWQVHGPGASTASALMSPLLAIAVIVVVLLAVRALRSGVEANELLPALTLAFVTALIAFNKVGSPQYITWLAVPVILGLTLNARAFRLPMATVLVLAALTQIIYPYLYGYLLGLNPLMLSILSVRNLLVIALFAWSVWALWQSARKVIR